MLCKLFPSSLCKAYRMSVDVFGNNDLLRLILRQAVGSPSDFIAVGRVSLGWRHACLQDESLVLASTQGRKLTKRDLTGLLALSSEEANSFPRQVRPRRGGGVMYLYDSCVAEQAWSDVVGGLDGWHIRLSARRSRQERREYLFGREWRKHTLPAYVPRI